MHALILLAQDPAPGGPLSGLTPLLPLIAICVLGWFLLFRPMQRQERERKAAIAALKKNDKVVAAGGILGTVAALKENEDEVTLKVDDNVRIRVLRSSIVKVIRSDEADKEPSKS